jgi:hypothetical protein
MGKYKNLPQTAVVLWVIGAIVTGLNAMLLMELLA